MESESLTPGIGSLIREEQRLRLKELNVICAVPFETHTQDGLPGIIRECTISRVCPCALGASLSPGPVRYCKANAAAARRWAGRGHARRTHTRIFPTQQADYTSRRRLPH